MRQEIEVNLDDNLPLSPKSDTPALINKDGLWVVTGGVDWSDVDVNDLIQRDREQRMLHLLGQDES